MSLLGCRLLVPPDVLSNSSSLNYYIITTEASTLIDPHTIERHNGHIGGVKYCTN